MNAAEFLKTAVLPAIAILGERYGSKEAKVMILAICGQESKFQARRQLISKVVNGKKVLVPEGPAVSFAQFEKGGIGGVLRHTSSARLAAALCVTRGVAPNINAVWEAMQYDDVLAAGMARLLLLTDPKALPSVGKRDAAWDLYERTWRPGKPHPETWPAAYANAVTAVGA